MPGTYNTMFDWNRYDPFQKAIAQVKPIVQYYNRPDTKARLNNPYYREQNQLKSQMNSRLQGVTDPAQRADIQAQYRQRIGGALQRAKSMGYDPSGNYNQNNLQKYYGQNGTNVQQLAARNDQGYAKNIGQSMAGATYKAAVDTLLLPANLANTAYAAGNYLYGNGRFQGHQGLSAFLDKARRWDSLVNKDGQPSTYDAADQLQGPIPDWQKGIQQAAAGAAIAGLPKAVSATGRVLDTGLRATGRGISGVVSNGTKAVKGVTGKAVNGVRNAGRSIVTKGKAAVKNVADAQKQWKDFRLKSDFQRRVAIRGRARQFIEAKKAPTGSAPVVKDIFGRVRDVHYSNKGLLGKTWDVVKNPGDAVKQAWRHGKWQDRIWHPWENTKQWWKYSNPIEHLKDNVRYLTNAGKYIKQGQGFSGKLRRLGTVSLDAGKNTGKLVADAGISQAARIGIDDYYNKQLQQVYADTSLSQQQKADKLNYLQRRRRGFKTVLGGVFSKYGPTRFSRLVGGTTLAQGAFAPLLQSGVQAFTGSSFLNSYWHPYATKDKQNFMQASRQNGLRYGNTDMFNHYLQRAIGDLGQGWFYSKVGGGLTGMGLQTALANKFGATANPFQTLDRSNVQRVNYQTIPIQAQITAAQNRVNQILNNPNLSDQQKESLTAPLLEQLKPFRQAIQQRAQFTNKGRLLDAFGQALSGQRVSDQNAYAALNQIGGNIFGRYMLRPFIQKQVDAQITNRRDLSNAIIAQKDPDKRAQLIQKMYQQKRHPLVQLAGLQAIHRDPQQAVRRSFKNNNITSQDIKTMAQAQQLAQQSDQVVKNGGSQFTRRLIEQLGVQGATAHYADLVEQAAKQGNTQKFGALAKDALWLMSQLGDGIGGIPQSTRLRKAFQSNMWTMIRKDPSLIPIAIGLGLGGSGAPGLGNFVAQNPVIALGGVAALFAIPTLLGGMRDMLSGGGKQMLAKPQAKQYLPQTDLYATTLRRRG